MHMPKEGSKLGAFTPACCLNSPGATLGPLHPAPREGHAWPMETPAPALQCLQAASQCYATVTMMSVGPPHPGPVFGYNDPVAV